MCWFAYSFLLKWIKLSACDEMSYIEAYWKELFLIILLLGDFDIYDLFVCLAAGASHSYLQPLFQKR